MSIESCGRLRQEKYGVEVMVEGREQQVTIGRSAVKYGNKC